MESNDIAEQDIPLLEGEYQYPNVSVKTFTSTIDLGNWLTLTRPSIIQIVTQQGRDGNFIYELKVQKEG